MASKLLEAQAALIAAQKRHQEEIEVLKKAAEQAKKEDIAAVISAIKDNIKLYGLTAADLGFKGVKSVRKDGVADNANKGDSPLKGRKLSVKLIDPETGRKYYGKGIKPQWVKDGKGVTPDVYDEGQKANQQSLI